MKKRVFTFILFVLVATLFASVAIATDNDGSEILSDERSHEASHTGAYGHDEAILDNYNKLLSEHEERRAQISEQISIMWQNAESRVNSNEINSGASLQAHTQTQDAAAYSGQEIIGAQSVAPQTDRSAADSTSTLTSRSSNTIKKSPFNTNGFFMVIVFVIIGKIIFAVLKISGGYAQKGSASKIAGQFTYDDDDFEMSSNDSFWIHQQQMQQQQLQQQMFNEQNRLFTEQVHRDLEQAQMDAQTAQYMHDQAVEMSSLSFDMHDHSFNDFNNFF